MSDKYFELLVPQAARECTSVSLAWVDKRLELGNANNAPQQIHQCRLRLNAQPHLAKLRRRRHYNNNK